MVDSFCVYCVNRPATGTCLFFKYEGAESVVMQLRVMKTKAKADASCPFTDTSASSPCKYTQCMSDAKGSVCQSYVKNYCKLLKNKAQEGCASIPAEACSK